MPDIPLPHEDPAADILMPLAAPKAVKAAAWDVFHTAPDQKSFESRLKALPLPQDVKATLWDRAKATGRFTPSPTGKVSPTAGQSTAGVTSPSLLESAIRPVRHPVETAVSGAQQAGRGLQEMWSGSAPGGREHGLRDVIEGSFEATTPVTLPLAVVATALSPADALLGMAVSFSGGKIAERVTQKFGGSEDTASLIGDVAGFLAPELPRAGMRSAARLLGRSTAASRAESAELTRISEQYGLNLSKAETMPQGGAGTIARQAQRAATSTITGGAISAAERRKGDAAALDAIDRAVKAIATPGTTEQAGQHAKTGLEAARQATRIMGQRVSAAAEQAPSVPLTLPSPETHTPSIASAIEDRFVLELKTLLDQPALARTADAVKAIEHFKNTHGSNASAAFVTDATGHRTLSDEAKLILRALPSRGAEGAITAPITEAAKLLYFKDPAKSNVQNSLLQFATIRKNRALLTLEAEKGDPFFGADPRIGQARQLSHVLTTHMHEISPEYGQAADAFREALDVIGRKKGLMTDLLNDLRTKPSTAVDYLAKGPEYARSFRHALLDIAPTGPEGDQAKGAYNVVRATFVRDRIFHQPSQVPGQLGEVDLQGMPKRLVANAPVLQELFGKDALGQQLLATTSDLARGISAHAQQFQRTMYFIFATASLMTGGSPARFLKAEAATGFLTWLLYHPTYAHVVTAGLADPAAFTRSRPVLTRIGQAYAATLGTAAEVAQQRVQQHAQPSSGGQ